MADRAKMPDGEDPYCILGVSPTASDAAITSAYRRLLHQYHPDTASSHTSADPYRLRQILAAYRQLRRDRREHGAGISTAIPITVHHIERRSHPTSRRPRPNEVWLGERTGESAGRPGRRRIPVRYRNSSDSNDDKPPAG